MQSKTLFLDCANFGGWRAKVNMFKSSIPVEVKTTQIIFTENTGVVLKSKDITQHGESSFTVFGENLGKGIYSFSLIIDGKVFETKKMVKM